jgi:hypothetical protein
MCQICRYKLDLLLHMHWTKPWYLLSALLWHRLMGTGVLSLDISGSPYLRPYAHCAKQKVRCFFTKGVFGLAFGFGFGFCP